MVRDGYYYGIGLLAVAVLVYLLTHGWIWALIPVLLALFFLWFFRDPERAIPAEQGLIVSPADGLVSEVANINTPDGPRQRISIFLSVFDVHVNRSPITGTLQQVRYQKGKYLNAMNPASADQNEQNIVTVEGEGVEVVFKQIAGLLARRIVFNYKVGDRVERGGRVGLIKFGSRVDVVLPANVRIRVAKGQRVKGGSSILGEIIPAGGTMPATDKAVEALV
ncbi:MAG TPA: phosphatidylserine decarboxylase family protein [Acidisarcina sp.]|nr:phosphatidylserine decarboxylase family protein [Acidisarcina sp.]